MTPQHAQLVQTTWEALRPHGCAAAALFYRRLFELEPGLRPMFRSDLGEQGQKLMQTLDVAVCSLGHFHTIVPALRRLGRQHEQYGVRDAHYRAIGCALMAMLRHVLGPALTPEAAEAWRAAFALIAGIMKDGAAEYRAARCVAA